MLHRGSSCSLVRAMDVGVMRHGIIVSWQSAATSKIVKVLLVMSLTHVSSAIASIDWGGVSACCTVGPVVR